MESEASLVRADSLVELNSKSSGNLHVSGVVLPWASELDNAFWLADGREYFQVVWVFFEKGFKGFEDFVDRLEEFGLVWVAVGDAVMKKGVEKRLKVC